MASSTMISKVKTALRISHSLLDGQIGDTIDAAEAELKRLGVAVDWLGNDNALLNQTIEVYCKAYFVEKQEDAEKYMKSFELMADNLRKSEGYRVV